MKACPLTSYVLIVSYVCLAWSISVSRELQGRSPSRWRWYRYSSTCRLMLRTSGSRSSSCPNLSEWPGWVCIVWSINALFTRSWVCSTCLRSSTDLTSAKHMTLTTLVQQKLFRLNIWEWKETHLDWREPDIWDTQTPLCPAAVT